MRRLLLLLLAGCAFALGLNLPDTAIAQDATPDATPDAAASIPFQATQLLPEDGSLIGVDTAITAVFNLPVVPLTSLEQQADFPAPFTLQPEAPGEGEWVNTSIYIFRPDVLAGDTTYTATLRPDLTAADGTPLAETASWSFITEPPRVVQALPTPDQPMARDGDITIRFNQAMDAASTAAALALTINGDAFTAFTSTWEEADRLLRLSPTDLLPYGVTVRVQVSTDAQAAGGGALAGFLDLTLNTVAAPAITGSDPYDGQTDAYPYGGLTLYFASPMNVETLRDRITVEPEPWREYDAYYSEYNNSYQLSFPTEPSTDYTITIAPGMEDVYGTPIAEETVIQYTTAPYDPQITFQVPGDIGFYNADADATQLYLTTRNVEQVDLSLSALSTDDLTVALERGYLDTSTLRPDASRNVRQWQLAPEADLNQLRYDLLNLTESGDPLPPGLYRLRAAAAELANSGYEPPSTVLLVGTAVLTVKSDAGGVLVWATEANTGEPITNAPIRILDYPAPQYDGNGNPISQPYTEYSGTTDADGIARIAIPVEGVFNNSRLAILDDGAQFGIGYTGWGSGIEGYNFGVDVDYNVPRTTTYLYTDRPVYRPGQPVYLRGVVRQSTPYCEDGDAGANIAYCTVRPTPDMPNPQMYIRIRDGNNTVVYEERLPLSPEGGFDLTYTLPPELPLGYYTAFTRLLDASEEPPEDEYNYQSGDYPATIQFGVLEYRAPEFQVELSPRQPEVAQGDIIQVDVDATYFFGGVLNGATFDYSVVASPFDFEYTGQGNYQFADYDYDEGASEYYASYGGEIASGSGTLDENGQAVIELPAELEDESRSASLTIEATVLDESGQAVSARTDVIVHAGEFYVGVQPEGYVATAGQESAFNLIAVDWESRPVPGQQIAVEVVERRWSSVQEMDDFGRTTWDYTVEEIPVTSGEVTTDELGEAVFSFTPPNGGVFKLKARAVDGADNPVISAATVYAAGGEFVAWRQQNSARIDLIADKADYLPGETAEILIASPFQGVSEALITLEQAGVIRYERVTMETNSFVYRIPIEAAYAPTVYVSAVIVHGVDENNPVASFRSGLVQLNVDTSGQTLTVAIERADGSSEGSETAAPGETLQYTIRTTDANGNPVSAEVGVALSDVATLTIAAANSEDILAYFYSQARLGVQTSTPLTINTDQTTQTILETIKGGGGGFGEGGIFDIRGEFVDTPYWNARLVTDENGEASFSIVLPDNLTTWRLDARAVATGDLGLLVGSTTDDLISTRPLLIRPVTPRFFTVGDQVTLAAIVNNNTGEDLSVQVEVGGEGFYYPDSETIRQTVEIPAGQQVRVNFPAVINNVDEVYAYFSAQATNPGDPGVQYADASLPPLGQGGRRTLPVYRAVPEIIGTSGVLAEAGRVTEFIQLPNPTVLPYSDAGLTVRTEHTLVAATLVDIQAFRNFRNVSTEFTASRLLANSRAHLLLSLVDDNTLTPQNSAIADLAASLSTEINDALAQLRGEQNIDGGWGWNDTEDSDALTTAWALRAVIEGGRAADTYVDDMVVGAVEYLRGQLIAPSLETPRWQLDRQAFVLYALASANQPEYSRVARLFEERARLSLWAKALLAQAGFALGQLDLWAVTIGEASEATPPAIVGENLNQLLQGAPETTNTNTLIAELVSAAQTSATGAFWTEAERDVYNWNTDTRTTAIVLDTLSLFAPTNPITANAVRWLVTQRNADSWETTQETAWALLSLGHYAQATGELDPQYTYSLAMGDRVITIPVEPNVSESLEFPSFSEFLNETGTDLTISRTDGQGSLYYTAYLELQLDAADLQPVDNGIVISRRYLREGSSDPVTEARVGETLTAVLTVIAPQDLHFVTVTDPIPAGTDAIDPALATSQQIGTDPSLIDVENPNPPWWAGYYFSNIEFRDEAVAMSASYLPAGTYEFTYSVRVGLEGVYNVLPPTASEQYFPEVYGRGAGSVFTILPAGE